MKNKFMSSKSIAYAQILLFLPAAWFGYNIVATLIIKFKTKELIDIIGWKAFGHSLDFILLCTFVVVGTFVAPKIVRLSSSVVSLLNYVIAWVWSITFAPYIFETFHENWWKFKTLQYASVLIPMLISIILMFLLYNKRIALNENYKNA